MPRIPRVGPTHVIPSPPLQGVDVEPDGAEVEVFLGEPTPAEVRAWAADNDIEVSSHGKVPTSVVEAYKAAQGG